MDELETMTRLMEEIRKENDGKRNDYLLPDFAAKQLNGYMGMRQDLIFAKEALNKSMEISDVTICNCLYYTFIGLYGKCFTDSFYPKFEEKDFAGSSDLLDTHKEIMQLRNNFAAHRGENPNEFYLAYLSMEIETYSKSANVRKVQRNRPLENDIPRYNKLLDFMIDLATQKFKKSGEKVWKMVMEKFTPEQFALTRIAGPVTFK